MAWFSRCIPLMAIHEVPAFPHLSRHDTDESSMLSHLLLAIVTIYLVIDLSDNYLSDDNYLSIMTRLLDVLG